MINETTWWILFILFCMCIVAISFLVTKFITEYIRERRTNVEALEIAPWVVHGDRGDPDPDVVQEA